MTKKDYDLIAACIGAAQVKYEQDTGKEAISDLSDRLVLEMKLDNPSFNESIFWERVEYWRKIHAKE